MDSRLRYIPTKLLSAPEPYGVGYDVAIKGSRLEMLEILVGVVTNNHDYEHIMISLEELAVTPDNMSFLGRLLEMKSDSLGAFAERLLVRAIESGRSPALVKMLLSHGADANNIDTRDSNCSLLEIACTNEHYAIAELLFEYGADVHAETISTDESLLTEAVLSQSPDLVRLLLSHGAGVNIIVKSEGGKTEESLLARAVLMADEEIIEILLSYGAKVNLKQSAKDVSPLTRALQEGNEEMIRKLLDYEATSNQMEFPRLDGVVHCNFDLAKRLFHCAVASLKQWKDVIVSAFIWTAWKGDVRNLQHLVDLQPKVFEELKQKPWLLYEATAFGADTEFHVDCEGSLSVCCCGR